MSDDYLNKPMSIGGSLGAPGKREIHQNLRVNQ